MAESEKVPTFADDEKRRTIREDTGTLQGADAECEYGTGVRERVLKRYPKATKKEKQMRWATTE